MSTTQPSDATPAAQATPIIAQTPSTQPSTSRQVMQHRLAGACYIMLYTQANALSDPDVVERYRQALKHSTLTLDLSTDQDEFHIHMQPTLFPYERWIGMALRYADETPAKHGSDAIPDAPALLAQPEPPFIHTVRLRMSNPHLERLVLDFFEDPLIQRAYMGDPDYNSGVFTGAFEQALLVAQAAAEAVQNEDDKEAVYAAALLYPCGDFLMALPWASETLQHDPSRPRQEMALVQQGRALSGPLRRLSRADEVLGRKMNFLLQQIDVWTLAAPIPPEWSALRQVLLESQQYPRVA